jgi:diacylglycerol O-acyltransferase
VKSTSRTQVSVVPLTSLDERYLTSSVIWEISRPAASIVLSAPTDANRPVGLDMQEIYRLFDSLTRTFPRLRQRIMPALLGIHAPAWVADDSFDITWHVRRHPEVLAADAIPPRLLAGLENGAMEPGRPPWDVLVAELDDGGLMFSLRYHHVIGDGLFGRSLLLELIRPSAGVRSAQAAPTRAPRNKVSLMLASGRAFTGSVGSVREGWQQISRVPVTRRLRRVAARNTRPLREWWGQKSGKIPVIAQREPRNVRLEFSAFRQYARSAGGGVGDLVAAVVASALTKMDPGRQHINLMIPVSGRVRGADPAGNQVKVMMVELPASNDLGLLTTAVAGQVAEAINANIFPALEPASWDAYATYLPGPPRPVSLLGRRVHSVVAWPAMDPREQYGIFAGSLGPVLELGMMVGQGLDADALAAAIEEAVAPTRKVSV